MLNSLYLQLEEDLSLIRENDNSPVKRLSSSLQLINNSLKELKAHVEKHPFQDEREEIEFFKSVKPKFLSLKIYELCIYNLDQVQPYDNKSLTTYYEEELRFIQRFFQQNATYYQYYRSGSEELDGTYFLRATAKEILTIELIPEQEVGFSTRCDYLFGKFIAYEKFSQELISRINRLNNYPLQIPGDTPQKQKKLTWTGDKVNMAELAYGLYYTGQINGGSCDVADIIAWLEDSLNLQMGSVHRKFIDIRRRKTISYTKFLDQMREAIHKRIEEDFVYKPTRGIQLQNGPSDTK